MQSAAAAWRFAAAAGVLAFCLALPGVGARSTYGAQTSVDEPQYLMTALSLAEDFDLDVSDEIEEEAYLSFHEIPLNTQTTPVDEAGRRFSPHDPLLPLILAPAMSVGGWVGARLFLTAIAAAVASLTCWVAIRRFAVEPVVALLVTTAFAGAQPLAPYATQVYPEMPAALAVITAVALLAGPRTARATIGVVMAIVALPWLAVKYVPVAAVLALWLFSGLRGDRRQLIGTVAALAVSGVVYAVVHQRIYGGWTVYAAGDHFAETGELSVVGTSPNYLGRSRRLVGLLVDRRFGLIPWQPLWLLAPIAVARFARQSSASRWTVAAVAAGYLTATFVALTMHGWWSPGRQLVVIVPLLVIAVSRLISDTRGLLMPAVLLGAAGVVNWLWLAVEANTDRRTLVVDFADTAALPYRLVRPAFPDQLAGSGLSLMWMWLVLLAASMLTASRSSGTTGET